MSVSTGRRAVIGATWMTGGGYFSFAVNFAANLLLARLLFPKDFGLFALISTVAELLLLLAGFSFSQGIIQMSDEPDIEDTTYILTVRLGAVLAAIGIIAAGVMWVVRGPGIGALLAAVFGVRLVTTFSYVYSAQLEREFRYRGISMLRIGSAVASVASALLLARAGAGVWSLVAREAVGILITYAGMRTLTRWRYTHGYNPETARRLIAFALRMFATRTFEAMNYRADVILLGVMSGTLVLGFYDRARFLAELGYYAVSFAAVQVAFPLYARFREDPARLGAAYRLIHYFLIRSMAPVALVMIVLPRELVMLLYGGRWESSVALLRWLAGYAFFLPILDNAKVLLTGIGRLNEIVRVRMIQFLVILPALLLSVPRWGASGAGVAASLSMTVGTVIAYWAISRSLPNFSLATYVNPILATLVAAAVTYAARGSLHPVLLLLLLPGTYLLALALIEREELFRNVRQLWPGRRIVQGSVA